MKFKIMKIANSIYFLWKGMILISKLLTMIAY